MTYLKRG